MAGAKYVPNQSFVPALYRSAELAARVLVEAERGAKEARSIAQQEAYRLGYYSDGIKALPMGIVDGRVQANISAFDFKSVWIEFGVEQRPATPCLRMGAEAAGLEVTGGGG